MTDQPTPTPSPVPPHLKSARMFMLMTISQLVNHARTLEEGPGRDDVRKVFYPLLNILAMIFSPDLVDAAQAHALTTLEIPHPHAPEARGQRVELSGITVELYAAELVKFLFVATDQPATEGQQDA